MGSRPPFAVVDSKASREFAEAFEKRAGTRPDYAAAHTYDAVCLAKWRKAYDFVLVDSPPILPVADARILASQVDGSIMVSRSSHCKRADVIQACADLSAAGSPLLGTVLVAVVSRRLPARVKRSGGMLAVASVAIVGVTVGGPSRPPSPGP